jgi:hypothetical protein
MFARMTLVILGLSSEEDIDREIKEKGDPIVKETLSMDMSDIKSALNDIVKVAEAEVGIQERFFRR